MADRRKDRRYLIRLANTQAYQPLQAAEWLRRLRALSAAWVGEVMNVRVSSVAIEFDLFVPPDQPVGAFLKAWENVGPVLTQRLLEEIPGTADPALAVEEARKLWQEERFWEVHETLETPWKAAQGEERELLQGLILAAAAQVHRQKDERAVIPSMVQTALARLKNKPSPYHGWDLEKFQAELKRLGIIKASL